jgi:hypothetical protein
MLLLSPGTWVIRENGRLTSLLDEQRRITGDALERGEHRRFGGWRGFLWVSRSPEWKAVMRFAFPAVQGDSNKNDTLLNEPRFHNRAG